MTHKELETLIKEQLDVKHVIINQRPIARTLYTTITVVNESGEAFTFDYHDDRLVFVSGPSVYIGDIEKMKYILEVK